MLGGVDNIKFSCYDGSQWQDSWDTSSQSAVNTNLPTAVKVEIQMAGNASLAAGGNRRAAGLRGAHQHGFHRQHQRKLNNETAKSSRTRDGRPAQEQRRCWSSCLWICLGLVSIALYFASSMTYELRAADNRVNGLAAEQAIEGASRYVSYVLANYATNGAVPDPSQFKTAAVQVGDAKFWFIGRDPDPDNVNASDPYFALIDENAKINLNTADTNELLDLPNMTSDFAEGIVDWRSTNSQLSLDYSSLGYLPKNAPRSRAWMNCAWSMARTWMLLAGDDINRNGVLDANEKGPERQRPARPRPVRIHDGLDARTEFPFRRHGIDEREHRDPGQPAHRVAPR